MSETKLLPCPFCGGENIKQGSTGYTFGVDIYIKCECGAKIQVFEEYGEENLINRWNTRKPIDDIVERLEGLKADEYYKAVEGDRDAGVRNNAYANAIDIVRNAGREGSE